MTSKGTPRMRIARPTGVLVREERLRDPRAEDRDAPRGPFVLGVEEAAARARGSGARQGRRASCPSTVVTMARRLGLHPQRCLPRPARQRATTAARAIASASSSRASSRSPASSCAATSRFTCGGTHDQQVRAHRLDAREPPRAPRPCRGRSSTSTAATPIGDARQRRATPAAGGRGARGATRREDSGGASSQGVGGLRAAPPAARARRRRGGRSTAAAARPEERPPARRRSPPRSMRLGRTSWATAAAQRDPGEAAAEHRHRGLEQELQLDVLGPRADRAAQADLADALVDRGQHQARRDDAADEERRCPRRAAGTGTRTRWALATIFCTWTAVIMREVVGLVGGEAVALAQDALDLARRRLDRGRVAHEQLGRRGSCRRSARGAWRSRSGRRPRRRGPCRGASVPKRLQDADHPEADGADEDLGAERVLVAEQLADDGLADRAPRAPSSPRRRRRSTRRARRRGSRPARSARTAPSTRAVPLASP